MRCAIYARYSSDRQKATSIDDQVRKCRQLAETKSSWRILDELIFTDEAVSGTRNDREGFNRMLEAAKQKRFDVLIVDDTSRFARDLPYALTQTEFLSYLGIELYFVAQGMSSRSEQFRMTMTMNGMIDEQYVAALGLKTKRGLEGAAIRGNHTGGRCFGYKNTPVYGEKLDAFGHREIVGSKLEVDPAQAETVRRIFAMYADGTSLKKIAKQLNKEGVEAPVPQLHRVQQSWAHTSIRAMLKNERYRGIVVFGKTRKVKHPVTKKRVKQLGSISEMVRKEFPEQRIVSEALWERVRSRIESVKKAYGDRGCHGGLSRAGAGVSNPYIFSGLLKCAECGANLALVSGRGKNHREPDYGCPMNKFRGTCSNSTTIRKDLLESQLLAKLQNETLRPEVITYTLDKFEEELTKFMRSVTSQMTSLESKRRKLMKEIDNLTDFVADGKGSSAIRSKLEEKERQLQTITEQISSSQPDSVRNKIRDTRRLVESHLRDIRRLLVSRADPQTTKAAIARHMPKIIMKPAVKPDGRKVYQVISEWELLGASLGRVVGAEGQS